MKKELNCTRFGPFEKLYHESKSFRINFNSYPSGPVASLINHRHGTRVIMFTGGFISALGLFLCSFTTEFYMALLTFGLITGR